MLPLRQESTERGTIYITDGSTKWFPAPTSSALSDRSIRVEVNGRWYIDSYRNAFEMGEQVIDRLIWRIENEQRALKK